MGSNNRSLAFWVVIAFLALSIPLLLAGQTLSLFDYDLTVRLGLQESRAHVGEFGVRVNQAFGAADTLVYVPLIVVSLIGLWRRRRWSLLTTAAVAGMSVYWTVTVGFMMVLLRGTPGYSYVPGIEIWLFVGAYLLFGLWCLACLIWRGDSMLR